MADFLKSFEAHGIVLEGVSGEQRYGDCPFCNKENKFYVNPKTGGWDCKVCMLKGFLSGLFQHLAQAFRRGVDPRLKPLAEDRSIDVPTLSRFEVGWNGKKYTIPVRGADGKTVDLRLYRLGSKCMSTPGATTGLFGAENIPKQRGPIYVCEGEWDAMALDMLRTRLKKEGVVVAVPGASVFKREWVPWFSGREIVCLYDADNAGEDGERLAWERLSGTAKRVRFVHWPTEAPLGFDTRDWVRNGIKLATAEKCWDALQKLINNRPRKLKTEEKVVAREEDGGVETEGILSPEETIRAYKKWLHLDSDDVLKIMFGTVFANRMEGEPIWLFLVDPPGGGKSELLMSLSEHSCVYATTSLTPHTLISGSVWSNGKDPSLIPLLDGKILIIKDFTTIISMHYTQSQEICGTLRDAYDGQTARNFGTGIRRSYKSKFGILAGVTDKIETFSTLNASLGERFLKFRMCGDTRETEEQKIMRALSNIGNRIEMRKQLCSAGNRTLNRPAPETPPVLSPDFLRRIVKLAQFTSVLRGTVDRDEYRDIVRFRPSYEIGTRLAVQLSKLASGIAIFLERREVGEEEYRLVRHVALDTAPDRIQFIVRKMYDVQTRPLRTHEVSEITRLPQATVFRLLQDMDLLQIVNRRGDGQKHLWLLSDRIQRLISEGGIYDTAPAEATSSGRPVAVVSTTPASMQTSTLRLRIPIRP